MATLVQSVADNQQRQALNLLNKKYNKSPLINQETNGAGWNSLFIAACYGYLPLVATLLKSGADPNIPNPDGVTPLWITIQSGHRGEKQLTIARELLAAGAQVDAPCKKKWTPLHLAAYYLPAAIPLLLQAGADINARNENGETPLCIAAKNNSIEAVYLLLRSGADPSVANLEGQRPLDFAKQYRFSRVVDALEENTSKNEPWTPLYEKLTYNKEKDPFMLTVNKAIQSVFPSVAAEKNYYHETLSPEEIKSLLSEQPPGAFLIRTSSKKDCIAISFVNDKGEIKKSLFKQINGSIFKLVDNAINETAELSELLKQYRNNFQHPLASVTSSPIAQPF